MRNIKLTIEYDGTDFKGWQTQKASERTVQQEIEKALKRILKTSVKLTGSGRTDSGVHALGQTANFTANTSKPVNELQNALNANLPDDIAIVKIENVPSDFHCQYSAKSKIYRYSILNRKAKPAYFKRHVLHYPYPLNLKLMRSEAKSLIGRHDFKSFQAKDVAKEYRNQDSIRTIKKIRIFKRDGLICVDIEADGFLYKMVRNIIGTLLETASRGLPPGTMARILKQKERAKAGVTAKAHGLSLLKVNY